MKNQSSIVNNIKGENVPSAYHEQLDFIRFLSSQIQKSYDLKEPIYSQQLQNNAKKFINKRSGTESSILSMINVCQLLKKPNVAAIILRGTDSQLIKSSHILQQYKSLLNATSTQEIVDYNIPKERKADLHFSAASSCIAAENFEGASEHLQAAIDAQPENEDYKQVSFLAAVLTDDQAKIESSFNKLDVETKQEIFSTFTLETDVKKAPTQTSTQADTTLETDTSTDTDYSEVKLDHKKNPCTLPSD